MTTIKYRIKWRARKTDAEGHGTGFFDYDEAKSYADQLNKSESGKWCLHLVEPVVFDGEEEPQS